MHTCRAIATGALRKIGKVAAGRDPRQADLDTAIEALRGLYRSMINYGAFGRLKDVSPQRDYVAGENERIFRNNYMIDTVKLPLMINDRSSCGYAEYGKHCCPKGVDFSHCRPPRDCAVVEIADRFTGATTQFIYDATEKKWMSLHDLGPDTRAPLADRDPEGLKCLLATEINDEFGGGVGELTVRRASEFRTSLAYRWSYARKGPCAEDWF